MSEPKQKKKRSKRANLEIEETSMIPAILEQLNKLLKEEIYVGVWGDEELAKVAAIQEYGSVNKGIPERSFLRAGMKKNHASISKLVRGGIKNVVETGGDVGDFMKSIGEDAAGKVKKFVDKLKDPPLSPITIARRKDHSAKPLVDTTELRDAIGFEVKPKK